MEEGGAWREVDGGREGEEEEERRVRGGERGIGDTSVSPSFGEGEQTLKTPRLTCKNLQISTQLCPFSQRNEPAASSLSSHPHAAGPERAYKRHCESP